MSEHTPGPWTVEEEDQWTEFRCRVRSGIETICHVEGCNAKGNPDDNALLIAAAPDMLKALRAQHVAIDTLFAMLIEVTRKPYAGVAFMPSQSGQPWDAIKLGNSAIDKAEGRPNGT